MTFIIGIIEGLVKALIGGYAESRRRNQEKLDQMYEVAYQQAQVSLKDLGPYDPETDGKFISIMEGCERE